MAKQMTVNELAVYSYFYQKLYKSKNIIQLKENNPKFQEVKLKVELLQEGIIPKDFNDVERQFVENINNSHFESEKKDFYNRFYREGLDCDAFQKYMSQAHYEIEGEEDIQYDTALYIYEYAEKWNINIMHVQEIIHKLVYVTNNFDSSRGNITVSYPDKHKKLMKLRSSSRPKEQLIKIMVNSFEKERNCKHLDDLLINVVKILKFLRQERKKQ